MPGQAGRAVLGQSGLDKLTAAWAIWAESESGRGLSRLRLHLYFLLARYGGLRPAEISAFQSSWLDLATGLLSLGERRIFLPAMAMRPLRRILTLAEAREAGFLQIDAGFLRRTFYAVGELAGLAPALCAPRALRNARALELLRTRMPPELVARALGFKTPLALPDDLPADGATPNLLPALLLSLDTCGNSARLICEISPRARLSCICSLEDLLTLECQPGQMLTLYAPPGALLPAEIFPDCANRLECVLLAITEDQLETRFALAHERKLRLTAAYDRLAPNFTRPQPGELYTVHIPPHLLQLRQN